MRCWEIAQQLGCDCHFDAQVAADIPSGYQIYVCVKPNLNNVELKILCSRGKVIWDIIDHAPPSGMFAYIASTRYAAVALHGIGEIHVIPHYHCNTENATKTGFEAKAIWVGHSHWYPQLSGVAHEAIFIDGVSREGNVRAYLSGDIGLNFRRERPELDFHLKVNPGIKLINCIGFGMPSVSANEPAYMEIGDECTIFCSRHQCGHWLERLKFDLQLFSKLKGQCMQRRKDFHLVSIVKKYSDLLESLR